MTTVFNTATDERTIRLILEVTREDDDSFSISIEDERFPEDSDLRYPAGLSEGNIFDAAQAAKDAAWVVERYLLDGPGQEPNEVGAIYRIAVPMEFKPSGE